MTYKTVQKISCNLATSAKEDHPRKKVVLNFCVISNKTFMDD